MFNLLSSAIEENMNRSASRYDYPEWLDVWVQCLNLCERWTRKYLEKLKMHPKSSKEAGLFVYMYSFNAPQSIKLMTPLG